MALRGAPTVVLGCSAMLTPDLAESVRSRAGLFEPESWPVIHVPRATTITLDIRASRRSALPARLLTTRSFDEFESWMALPDYGHVFDRTSVPFEVAVYVAKRLIIDSHAAVVITGAPAILLVEHLVIHDLGRLTLNTPARVVLGRLEKRAAAAFAVD
jgi:hypothetical protein